MLPTLPAAASQHRPRQGGLLPASHRTAVLVLRVTQGREGGKAYGLAYAQKVPLDRFENLWLQRLQQAAGDACRGEQSAVWCISQCAVACGCKRWRGYRWCACHARIMQLHVMLGSALVWDSHGSKEAYRQRLT